MQAELPLAGADPNALYFALQYMYHCPIGTHDAGAGASRQQNAAPPAAAFPFLLVPNRHASSRRNAARALPPPLASSAAGGAAGGNAAPPPSPATESFVAQVAPTAHQAMHLYDAANKLELHALAAAALRRVRRVLLADGGLGEVVRLLEEATGHLGQKLVLQELISVCNTRCAAVAGGGDGKLLAPRANSRCARCARFRSRSPPAPRAALRRHLLASTWVVPGAQM